MEVDYLKLSEQYAGFLVALGGVSITVLTLVLSFSSESAGGVSYPFLVAALLVATISCFIGAHMMAETAAFITYSKVTQKTPPSGERLFVLASSNIFVATILLIFALMLLPAASGKVDVASINPISISVFGLIVASVLCWMVLTILFRIRASQGCRIIVAAFISGVLWGCFLGFLITSRKELLWVSFISIVVFTTTLLIHFAWTFGDGGKARKLDILFFSLAITLSCASLVVAGIKSMFGN